MDELPDRGGASNWREFLQNANLYYRPNRSIAYSIDPFMEEEFRNIATRLRDLTGNPLPFSEGNVLTLNLTSLLELEVSDESRQGFGLPTYSIETEYGYWVPKPYVDYIEKKLSESSEPRRQGLEERGRQLQEVGETYARAQIKKYLDEVDIRLKNDSGQLTLSNKQKELIYEKILRRVRHLTKLLTHPKTLERLSRSLIGAPVPGFWEDEASVNRFFESFCFDITDKLASPKNIPAIISKISYVFGISYDDDSETCRAKIEEYFTLGKTFDPENW